MPAKVAFNDVKKFFAVDDSGSTIGPVMRAQKLVVLGLHANKQDMVTKWDFTCQTPQLLDSVPSNYWSGTGGTSPASIIKNPAALNEIMESDVWLLLTDGQIGDPSVVNLTNLAEIHGVTQVPVILIITGPRRSTPAEANISVGVSFFASARDALILFREDTTCYPFSSQLFLIDAKGAFDPLLRSQGADLQSWESLPTFDSEAEFNKRCGELDIEFVHHNERQPFQSAISLGSAWDAATHALVDIPLLLTQQKLRAVDLRNLLGEQAITHLALICKTRGELGVLRDLILKHKQQEVIVRLEDRHGAGQIMERMQAANVTLEEKGRLMEQLRAAHSANRTTYETMRNSPNDEARVATELNKLINRALAIISEFEKSSYTADILSRKSNRAMRAEVISASDAEMHLSALDLSDGIEAFRGTCSICCGENQIMSVVLKELETVEENTTDFALNFPLAAAQAKQNANMVSSQCICFQCALLCPESIYHENIIAILPSIDYSGVNKTYINHQLTLAITAGLNTGASGIVQLFLTILDRTLETKEWCSKDHIHDSEVFLRRQVLDWTLHDMLHKCKCRENFTETGQWVSYPAALAWAVSDYELAGLDSWAIQYPVAGFNQLLRWYEILSLVSFQRVESMKMAKLLNLTVTNIMKGVLDHNGADKAWTQPFLELIYSQFNAPGIPKDLGSESLVPAKDFWPKLEAALGPWADIKRFLSTFGEDARRTVAIRLQIVTFWALFIQKGHTTPKYFFSTIKTHQPLAPAVLDPDATVPNSAIQEVLTSIFCPNRETSSDQRAHLGTEMPPFVSPFGPSVLHCGTCDHKFSTKEDLKSGSEAMALIVRENRAKHLKEVYAVRRELRNDTGLPEPTAAPKAPVSYHNTLHISTARVWSALPYESKQAIARAVAGADDGAIAAFARDVQLEVCAKSRRGDIYSSTIEDEVRKILPSLLIALKVASERAELEDKSGLGYVYDWALNRVQTKMEWELALGS
ncbi:hypothetical protein P7C71_g2829, partial [Lecanoromycetidae sp. Uapishka_2]